MKYLIESKDGTIYGTYPGDTPEQAFAAMVADGIGDTETAGTVDDWIVTPMVWQPIGNAATAAYELRIRHGMIVSPLDDPMVQEFIDEETDDGTSEGDE